MKLLLSILMVLALCSLAGAQTADLVKADLVADTQAIEPGKPFQVALHLTIADGWHVYWINPGDAGAPTTLKLTLPKGFTAGPVQYPVPEKMPQPGNLTVYAYEHELLLTETITPPADLFGSTITISANAGWCVCNPEKCVLGKKDLSLDLPVAKTMAQATNQELFAAWLPRMPAKSDEMFDDISITFKYAINGGIFTRLDGYQDLAFKWKGNPPATDFVWLPGPCDDLTVGADSVTTLDRFTGVQLRAVPIQGIVPTSSTLTGVLAYYPKAGSPRGVAVSVDRRKLYLPTP